MHCVDLGESSPQVGGYRGVGGGGRALVGALRGELPYILATSRIQNIWLQKESNISSESLEEIFRLVKIHASAWVDDAISGGVRAGGS